jgi:zinc protease
VTTDVQTGLAPVGRTLPNGVRTIVQHTTTHPAVTIALMLPAGSAYDPVDRLGLAHFVSRVIDRGTHRRSSAMIAEDLDDRGVTLSTGVNRHLFLLNCLCLTEDVGDILNVLADVVRNPVFPHEEVETRRGEIVTALRQDEDNPAAVASEQLMALLYPSGHPYGRPARGSVESVQQISRDDLIAFHRVRFFPEGLTIAVVGEVGPEDAFRLVESAFGDWRASSNPMLIPPAAPRLLGRQRRVITMTNKAQADIAYGFAALRRRDPDYYAALLMNNVLGQYGLGGRLGDSIRERQGMAYYAYSSFDGNIAEGPLVIRAGVAAENVDRTVASIDEEVERMAADGITPGELDDAKRYMIGSMPRVLETNTGIATFLLTAELFGLGLDYDRRLSTLIEQVSLTEVNTVARRLLAADRAALVVAGPYADRAAGSAV